jgi:apolipoprotein N-acyltransferase
MEKLYNHNFFLCSTLFFIGGLATLSITPFSISPLIFTLGLGVYIVHKIKSLKKIFFISWFLGLGWFLFGLHWIGSAFLVSNTYHVFLMPLAVIILPCVMALFWALAFWFSRYIGNRIGHSIFITIITLSIAEYIRANIFTGFPWLMPSIILSSNEYTIQIFSFVGSFTGNLIVFIVSLTPVIVYYNWNNKYLIFFILFLPIISIFYAAFSRYEHREKLIINDKQLITIVQPNIKQKDKWDGTKRESHLKKLVQLSTFTSKKYNNKFRIVIWPETGFEGLIPRDLSLLTNTIKAAGLDKKTSLVTGLLNIKDQNLFNSMASINSSGNIEYIYNKIHLVPFGEYIPFRLFFKNMAQFISKADFSSGKNNDVMTLPNLGHVLPLICYEVLFSGEVRKRISNKTRLIINITNDAWFGSTIGPYQHFALAKIRAVELGIPLVRVANTGISALISPYGNEIIKIKLNKEDTKTTYLVSSLKSTLYKKYGDWIFLISILYVLFINLRINKIKLII